MEGELLLECYYIMSHDTFCQICLDEAQMIEGKYTNAARMVQQLSAAHRWCVTGTPLQQGVCGMSYHCVAII